MRVNYGAIADEVQIIGSRDYVRAFSVLTSQTVAIAVDEAVIDEAAILSGLGLAAGALFITQVESLFPAPVIRVLRNKGINVADPEARRQIAGLVDVISLEAFEWLTSKSTVSVPRWPGLKIGHVQNAIQYRREGRY